MKKNKLDINLIGIGPSTDNEESQTKDTEDRIHKIVILGDRKVGKTSIFLRYMYFDKSQGL